MEMKYGEEWGTVNDVSCSLEAAAVVCRQLKCGDALDAPTASHFGSGVGLVWLTRIICEGTESALNKCFYFILMATEAKTFSTVRMLE